jgi:hypothetical protein
MIVHRRRFIAASGFAAVSAFCRPAIAQTNKLHFGVGPLLPSPDDALPHHANDLERLQTCEDCVGIATRKGLDMKTLGGSNPSPSKSSSFSAAETLLFQGLIVQTLPQTTRDLYQRIFY